MPKVKPNILVFLKKIQSRIKKCKARLPKKSLPPFLLLTVLLIVGTLGFFYINSRGKTIRLPRTSRKIIPSKAPSRLGTPSPKPTLEIQNPRYPPSLFEEEIAYLKNGDVYLFNKEGEVKITNEGNIEVFRWSPNGRRIAYAFNVEDEGKKTTHSIIKLLDVDKSQLKTLVDKRVGCDTVKAPENKLSCPEISSLDFFDKGKKIVYTLGGLWFLDIISGEDKQLMQREITGSGAMTVFTNNPFRVQTNRENNIFILTFSGFESQYNSFFDFDKKKEFMFEDLLNEGFFEWLANGQQFINFTDCYRDRGGVLLFSIDGGTRKRIVGNAKKVYCLPIVYATDLNEDNIVFALSPFDDYPWTSSRFYETTERCDTFFDKDQEVCLPQDSEALIILLNLNNLGDYRVLKELKLGREHDIRNLSLNGHYLSSSPSGDKISFLAQTDNPQIKGLYVLDIDGLAEGVLFEINLDSVELSRDFYQWRPSYSG